MSSTDLSSDMEEEIEENQHCAKKKDSDPNISDLDAATSLTNSSTEIERLYEKFKEVLNTQSTIYIRDSKCLMECGRQRATVLLPCKHQPICKECYVIWKIYVLQHKKSELCPACKSQVIDNIFIHI